MADKPIVPVAASTPVEAKPVLSVVFSRPSWQSTKPNAAKRLADVQLLGMFSTMPLIALAGITIAQENRDVILYLPSASRVGSAKAITARMMPATQTLDGESVTVMVPAPRGERQISRLTDAIIDAWADANESGHDPYNREITLDLGA